MLRFLHAIATAEKPLIAAVNGHGVGIGTTMLLHCDVVIIAEDAQLTTPFTSLGLTPEAASSLLLPARIGHTRAFMMLALGQPISGVAAVRYGIATEALPRWEVDSRARALALECCTRPAEAMRITKMLMRDTRFDYAPHRQGKRAFPGATALAGGEGRLRGIFHTLRWAARSHSGSSAALSTLDSGDELQKRGSRK